MWRAICLAKNKMQKRKIKKAAKAILITLAVLLILLTGGFFFFRETLLQKAIIKAKEKMAADYNSTFIVGEAAFEGLSGVRMKQVAIVPHNADTLLNIREMRTSVNLGSLLTGDVQLGTLVMKNGYIQLVKNASGSNYAAFLKKDKATEDDSPDDVNYARRAYRLLNRALNLVPTDMELSNLSLRIDDMGRKLNLQLKDLTLANEQLESSFVVRSGEVVQTWKVKGMADPRGRKADLKFFNTDTSRIQLPYISERYGLKSGFDTIHLNVANIEMDGGELHLDGFAAIKNFMVNHPKIATKDVIIKNARFDYHLLLGPKFIAVDSTSVMKLNSITLHPYARYSVEEDTVYEMKARIPKMFAQNFINSLPKGLFTNFEGMEAKGTFSYDLDFKYNKNKPRELVFESGMKKDSLKIVKYGNADLGKLNTAFEYRAIEKGKPQRAITVGPSNPFYTPLGQISPYLRKAVLTSEDPSFFRHRGFITEAFRQSIIKNIKTKKFSRGASTISMQLVKNVFLTREKTLSRKLEEILLVYILENNHITSKERMLEVYFNIIEWGPNVYGIGEAASYYFGKHPADLSLDECIYLASIIPRPKGFMWQFNDQGNLKPFAVRHNKYIRDLMLRRGLLVAEDTIGQNGHVYISGRGRSLIHIREAEPVNDSISTFEEFDF